MDALLGLFILAATLTALLSWAWGLVNLIERFAICLLRLVKRQRAARLRREALQEQLLREVFEA